MRSEIEKLEGLQCRLKITVPTEEVEQAYQKRLKEVAKDADIKGFRPGKVPLHIIEKKFGKNIHQEVAGALMQDSFEQAVQEHNLQIAGSPEVNAQELDRDKPIEYEAVFETYPEIEFKDLEGETIQKSVAEISDDDVDDMIEKLRKQHSEWEDVDRAAENGDRVVIDFEGFIDDKPFEGGQAKEFKLELGSKQMIPGFEEGLIGVKAGETVNLNVTFPEKYPVEDLAGKPAEFKVTVHKVQAGKLPPVDDELAKKVGIEDGLEKLREEIRKNMESELNHLIHSKLKSDVLDRLLNKNTVLLPKALIESEIQHLQQMTRQQMAIQQGAREIPEVDLPREPFVEEAHKRVSLGLLLSEAIKKYDVKLDQDKVREKVNEIAASYQKPEEVVSWYYKNKKLLSEIEAALLEDQVVDKLLEDVNLEENKLSYNELMEQASKQGK